MGLELAEAAAQSTAAWKHPIRQKTIGSLCPLKLLLVVVMLVPQTVDHLHMDLVVKASCDPSDLYPLVIPVVQGQPGGLFTSDQPSHCPLSHSPASILHLLVLFLLLLLFSSYLPSLLLSLFSLCSPPQEVGVG